MDLEEYYGHLVDVRTGTLPQALATKAIGTWLPRYERGLPSPVWSQEWANYEHVEEWISPWSGWLVTDFSFRRNKIGRGIARAYRTLGTKGIIIPVAYKVCTLEWNTESEQVLVRIGKRLYIVYSTDDVAEPVGIVALPASFDDTFDSHTLQEFCANRNNWLHFWLGDGGEYGLGGSAEIVDEVFSFLETHPQALSSFEPNPEKWTNEEWSSLQNNLD